MTDASKKMVKFGADGSIQVNIDPKACACEKDYGLLVPARQGSAVLFYHMSPDGVMNGKVDPNTLYQLCNGKGEISRSASMSRFNPQFSPP